MEKLKELLTETEKMRNLQKKYFRTRLASVLVESKVQEKRVDDLIAAIKDTQTSLDLESEQYGRKIPKS